MTGAWRYLNGRRIRADLYSPCSKYVCQLELVQLSQGISQKGKQRIDQEKSAYNHISIRLTKYNIKLQEKMWKLHDQGGIKQINLLFQFGLRQDKRVAIFRRHQPS